MVDIDKLINIPSGHVSSLPLIVTVYNLADDKPLKVYHLDYGNEQERKLIGRITLWALQNKCSVETVSKQDYERMEKE